jgi:SAM-dependent methyltransferase
MYAISTVGSLLGTFAATLLLIPLLGTQRTFLTFALLLTLVAAWGLGARYLLAPAAIVVLLALPAGTVKDKEGAGRVVEERDTEMQYARVVEYPDGERHMELNEGQAVHSLYRPETVLTENVWDGYLIVPFAGLERPPERIAILGFAGGTTARAYEKYFPRTRIDGVEIDGELFDLAKRWFGLNERPELELHAEDARPFLRRSEHRYDAIFVDAYRQPYIPFYLTSREFFELARDRLRPGGVVIVNVGHPENSDELEQVLTATIGDVFANVARDPIEELNTLLIASDEPVGPERLRAVAPSLPADLRPLAYRSASRMGRPLDGGTVYTDDRAPVEWLIDESIISYAAGGGGE